ncbi:MAG: hypothetical protein KIT25_23035 [Enhydrobacter sp.]|nr:MAG: hypothetical protein KIT25_23035 [Enhydrobacter sp.]
MAVARRKWGKTKVFHARKSLKNLGFARRQRLQERSDDGAGSGASLQRLPPARCFDPYAYA